MNIPINSDLKLFCKVLAVIALGLFVADRLVGGGFKYLYQKQSSGMLYRSSYVLDSTMADFLVFGSSRANHHYDPKVFEERLKSTFYNCGRDDQGSIYSCAMISAVIDRYKPKCIIIDIRPDEFTHSDVGKISSLFPYNENKIVRAYYRYNGPFEKVKFVSHIYPYNSLLTSLLVGITSFNKTRRQEYHGYLPLKETNEKKYSMFKETEPIDTAKVRYFKELLIKLDELDLPTFVVISPIYSKVIDGSTPLLTLKMCSRLKSVKFLDFTHCPRYKNAKYFYDSYHLNEYGAKLFSNELIATIKGALKSIPD